MFYWPIHKYFGYSCAPSQQLFTQEEATNCLLDLFLFEKMYQAQKEGIDSYKKSLMPELIQASARLIKERYSLDSAEMCSMLQAILVEFYFKGFVADYVFPILMSPQDVDKILPSQAESLKKV